MLEIHGEYSRTTGNLSPDFDDTLPGFCVANMLNCPPLPKKKKKVDSEAEI